MTYLAHRPKAYEGHGDSHLPQAVRQLRRTLSDVQRDFAYDTLRLPPKALGELAGIFSPKVRILPSPRAEVMKR
jgi:hypothetical protein